MSGRSSSRYFGRVSSDTGDGEPREKKPRKKEVICSFFGETKKPNIKRKVDGKPEDSVHLPTISPPRCVKPRDSMSQPLEELLEASKGHKCTPLERQVLDLKSKYPKLILFVECGYRYRFFGEDAITAARVLDISVVTDKFYFAASVPTFHGPIGYVRKFVEKGYKVGIVSQKESSISRKRNLGESRKPFDRDLTEIYTASTLISESQSLESSLKDDPSGRVGGILALYETPILGGKSFFGIVCAEPQSGRVIYDEFEDGKFRRELSTRLASMCPSEILYSEPFSSQGTRDLIHNYGKVFARLEPGCKRFDSSNIEDLCKEAPDSKAASILTKSHGNVMKSLGAMYSYLKEFMIEDCLIKTGNFFKFGELCKFMKIPAMTMSNLGMFFYKSKEEGSLYNFINHTFTKFGSRNLRNWLSQPLMEEVEITRRQDAIEELMSDINLREILSELLRKMPDLELALMSSLNKRISPKDFFRLCHEMNRCYEISLKLSPSSQLLQYLVRGLKECFMGLDKILNKFNLPSSKGQKPSKNQIFRDWSDFEEVIKARKRLAEIEWTFERHKSEIIKILGVHEFEYSSVSGMDYLIEVKNSQDVPDSWVKVNSTKSVSRYRDSFLEKNISDLYLAKELLEVECAKAWKDFLTGFGEDFHKYQMGVRHLSELDSLFALYVVSSKDSYCRPSFNNSSFEIIGGRNPVVESRLPLGHQYVPNDISLGERRSLILMGPNMGGKSSFLRQVASICIMAQMGCRVPAGSAKLPLIDAIYLRTGAKDDLWNNKSTLYIELEETSEIVNGATQHSLVLLDELGRGTSTYDGMAIAESVLRYLLLKNRCFTVFVTHFKQLVDEFEVSYPNLITSAHVGYEIEGDEEYGVLFLYRIVKGATNKSYGLNVGKLAGLDSDVLEEAKRVSHDAEADFKFRANIVDFIRDNVLDEL